MGLLKLILKRPVIFILILGCMNWSTVVRADNHGGAQDSGAGSSAAPVDDVNGATTVRPSGINNDYSQKGTTDSNGNKDPNDPSSHPTAGDPDQSGSVSSGGHQDPGNKDHDNSGSDHSASPHPANGKTADQTATDDHDQGTNAPGHDQHQTTGDSDHMKLNDDHGSSGNGNEHDDEHGNGTDHGNGTHSGHKVERFHVATIDFDRVAVPFIISAWIIFATVAKIVFHLNHKLPAIFPESCLLIVLGIIVGIVLYFTNTKGYELDSNLFFFYLLPPIILEAGYFMPIRSFFDNIGTILCFAVIGTLINTFLIGFSLFAFSEHGLGAIDVHLDVLHCLVFGALISAVDPVAVLAVFDEVAVNEILHICVFGESLLNDAVTVVLYHMMEGFSHIGKENIITQDILAGIGSFFIVGIGGTIVGVLLGLLASFMTRFTVHIRVVEPLIVFVIGYMSYITAEIFHLSGIMACVFCGITMRKYVEVNISRKSHTTIKYFMKMIASLTETIIFMFLGMSTVADTHEWNTSFVLFSVIFCIVYRALAVIVQCLVLNSVRANKLSKVDQFIMAYGGLRGAIAFSLAVLLNGDIFPEKHMLITATLVVVYFTVFVQGTTIKPLVKVLRVKRAVHRKPNMNEKLHDRLIDHTMAGIEDITGHFGHHEMRARFQKIDNLYIKPVVLRKGAAKYRGTSILQVFNKLNERDAQEYLRTKGSFIQGTMEETFKSFNSMFTAMARGQPSSVSASNSAISLNSLVGKQQSKTSLPVDNSSTVLDLKALDPPESRKLKDDSKVHHILEDAMFKPRKRFHRHHRHMLPNEQSEADLYHHNIKKNLRRILSHAQHDKETRRHHGSKKGQRDDDDKPRKNVSFANATELEVKAAKKAEDSVDKSKLTPREPDDSQSHISEDSDGGIIFTVSKVKDGDLAEASSLDNYTPAKPPAPTITEITLPWRSAAAEPVSMESIYAINGEDDPCPGIVPWSESVVFKGHQSDNGLAEVHEPPPKVMETIAAPETSTKEEAIHCFSSSIPQLAYAGRPEPDIVNCSTPSEPVWTHKIDDFHEHDGQVPMPDLGTEAHTDLVMSSTDLVTDGPSTPMSGPDDCYLPATWRTTEEMVTLGQSDQGDALSGVVGDHQPNLPPPWKSSPDDEGLENDDDSVRKSNAVFELGAPSESASARSLPWESHSGDVVVDMEGDEVNSDIDQSSMRCLSTDSAPAAEDCLPPPWRSVNVSEPSVPVRSPSASHELDSLVPQASHNSLRLSEAESRHSEQFRGHHHVIDIGPRELEHSSSGSALSSMVGDDSEPLDLVSRVQRWLLDTTLDHQEPVPDDLYDAGPHHHDPTADLSDTVECEDTYL